MQIKVSTIIHYLLIYILLLMSYSCFVRFNVNINTFYFIILIFYFMLICTNKKYWNIYSFVGIAIIFVGVVLQRLLNGGAGFMALLDISMPIFATHMAICYDKNQFLNKFVNIVKIMALFSLIIWSLFCIIPNLAISWPVKEYFTQAIGSEGYETFWYGKGMFLYSYLSIHPTRNCGIFTEPGVYQIVLNSVLFILLFWKHKITFKDDKSYYLTLFIILITIISTTSTTGYIAMVILICCYMLKRTSFEEYMLKRKILLFSILVLISAFIDLGIRGESSLLYEYIIVKLFGSAGDFQFDFSSGSGQYRWRTIQYCLQIISKHPFGIGFEAYNIGKDSTLVAASLLAYAAVFGVVIWSLILIWFLYPLFKFESKIVVFAFILMFVNTTLAQTMLIYPAQFLIPAYLIIDNIDYELR